MKRTLIITALMILLCTTVTEARTVFVGTDAEEDTIISVDGRTRTGWFKLKGKTYYAYRTGKHELARNCYRLRHGKLYYLGDDGAVLTKSERYIVLHRDHSVKWVNISGMEGILRFNADRQRYQYRDKNGKWKDTGMPCWPYGMIDRRK